MSEDQRPANPPLPRDDDDHDLTANLREQEDREIEQRRAARGQTPNAPDRDDPTTADAGTSEADRE